MGRSSRSTGAGAVLACLAALGLTRPAPAGPPGRCEYEVRVDPGRPDVFAVSLRLESGTAGVLRLSLPHAERRRGVRRTSLDGIIKEFRAVNGRGDALRHEASGTGYWTVRPGGAAAVEVSYVVSSGPRGRRERRSMLFVPSHTLLYPVGREAGPARLRFHLPPGWQLACGLAPVAGEEHTFSAASLAELYDSPALLGQLFRTDFEVEGIPFAVVFSEKPRLDVRAFVGALEKIAAYQMDLFRVRPFDRYLFLVLLHRGRWSTGADHTNSCVVFLSRRSLERTRARYLVPARMLVRAWNSRFIHAESHAPVALGGRGRSRSLWFQKGVSEYYAERSLYRTGLVDAAAFFTSAARHLAAVEQAHGYGQTSIAESGWASMERGRRRSHLSSTSSGFLLGLVLDVRLRQATHGKRSLDDVMRFLGWWFGRQHKGYRENHDLESAVSTVAETDFSAFFAAHVEGTTALPVEETLALLGYQVVREERSAPNCYRFMRELSKAGLEVPSGRVTRLDQTSSLYAAGLRPGDRIQTILGVKLGDYKHTRSMGRDMFSRWLSRERKPESVPITYQRRGRTKQADVKLPRLRQHTVSIVKVPGRRPPTPLKAWFSPTGR